MADSIRGFKSKWGGHGRAYVQILIARKQRETSCPGSPPLTSFHPVGSYNLWDHTTHIQGSSLGALAHAVCFTDLLGTLLSPTTLILKITHHAIILEWETYEHLKQGCDAGEMDIKKYLCGQVWWHMLLLAVLTRQRQADLCELKARLLCIVNARLHSETLSQKKILQMDGWR